MRVSQILVSLAFVMHISFASKQYVMWVFWEYIELYVKYE